MVLDGSDQSKLDFGFIGGGSIGDLVWNDINGDGVQNGVETVLGSVSVTLVFAGVDGDFDTTLDNLTITELTDGDGNYGFFNLPNGLYRVDVEEDDVPAGLAPTTFDPDRDKDAIAKIALTSTDNTLDGIDFGFSDLATISDFVWEDVNGDGLQTDEDTGIDGVTVNLRDASGTSFLESTTTDADGNYSFRVTPGTYVIEFVTPEGFVLTVPNQGGDDAVDSDADATTGFAAPVSVTAGDFVVTIDAGMYRPASLGDRVWHDLNGNGRQDTGEPGVSGVDVQLLDAGSSQVAATSTSAGGAYQFADLPPGDYIVVFDLPSGFDQFAVADQGGDSNDSDADGTGKTSVITLQSGDNDLTVDAGVVQIAIDIEKLVSVDGGVTFQDADIEIPT